MNEPNSRSEPYLPRKFWWARVKILVKSQLDRFPHIKTLGTRFWRTWIRLLLKCRLRLVAMTSPLSWVDINKTVWVSPQEITFCARHEFNVHYFKGRIIGGDWDCLGKRFTDLDIYIGLKQVCVEEKDWRDTIFYQRTLNRLNNGEILWGCKNKSDLEQRCKNLESLYQRIKQEGYKSQSEMLQSQNSRDYNPLNIEDEVTVSVGRNGDLLFSNSAHRLAIAKILGIKKIPVKIAVRHPEWIRFRKEILQNAKEQGGKICQPAIHPDLDEILTTNQKRYSQ